MHTSNSAPGLGSGRLASAVLPVPPETGSQPFFQLGQRFFVPAERRGSGGDAFHGPADLAGKPLAVSRFRAAVAGLSARNAVDVHVFVGLDPMLPM